jgi:hypothetical protein
MQECCARSGPSSEIAVTEGAGTCTSGRVPFRKQGTRTGAHIAGLHAQTVEIIQLRARYPTARNNLSITPSTVPHTHVIPAARGGRMAMRPCGGGDDVRAEFIGTGICAPARPPGPRRLSVNTAAYRRPRKNGHRGAFHCREPTKTLPSCTRRQPGRAAPPPHPRWKRWRSRRHALSNLAIRAMCMKWYMDTHHAHQHRYR